ncbi:unnamed protein product [Amoebophrya sp. A120]|nr:unnamed protein product [Amoebophrya sp. A120]|eukprot:GSA120T00016333001.1
MLTMPVEQPPPRLAAADAVINYEAVEHSTSCPSDMQNTTTPAPEQVLAQVVQEEIGDHIRTTAFSPGQPIFKPNHFGNHQDEYGTKKNAANLVQLKQQYWEFFEVFWRHLVPIMRSDLRLPQKVLRQAVLPFFERRAAEKQVWTRRQRSTMGQWAELIRSGLLEEVEAEEAEGEGPKVEMDTDTSARSPLQRRGEVDTENKKAMTRTSERTTTMIAQPASTKTPSSSPASCTTTTPARRPSALGSSGPRTGTPRKGRSNEQEEARPPPPWCPCSPSVGKIKATERERSSSSRTTTEAPATSGSSADSPGNTRSPSPPSSAVAQEKTSAVGSSSIWRESCHGDTSDRTPVHLAKSHDVPPIILDHAQEDRKTSTHRNKLRATRGPSYSSPPEGGDAIPEEHESDISIEIDDRTAPAEENEKNGLVPCGRGTGTTRGPPTTCMQPRGRSASASVEELKTQNPPDLVLVLENLRNFENIKLIERTAEVFGVKKIWILQHGVQKLRVDSISKNKPAAAKNHSNNITGYQSLTSEITTIEKKNSVAFDDRTNKSNSKSSCSGGSNKNNLSAGVSKESFVEVRRFSEFATFARRMEVEKRECWATVVPSSGEQDNDVVARSSSCRHGMRPDFACRRDDEEGIEHDDDLEPQPLPGKNGSEEAEAITGVEVDTIVSERTDVSSSFAPPDAKVRRQRTGEKLPSSRISSNYATRDTKANRPGHKSKPKKSIALVLGSESSGISAEMRAFAHRHVWYPVAGKCESFNVAVCSGVMLAELRAQRPEFFPV